MHPTTVLNPTPSHRSGFKLGAYAVALLAGATLVSFWLDHHVSLASQAMFFVLAVVLAAYAFGKRASLAFALVAVTTFNFFFVPPRWNFAVDNREHLIVLATMLLVAFVISHLNSALRRETEAARRNEHRARQLQALASALSAVTAPAEVMTLGQTALDAAFDGPCLLATRRPDGQLNLPQGLPVTEVDGMQYCMREAAVLGPGTGRWPGLNAWYLPVGEKDRVHGAACIHNVTAADTEGRAHAQALCALLAQGLWRLSLSGSILAAQQETQRQQIQSTFLAAISHDLRTPLAAIIGAATSLQTQSDKLSEGERRRLLTSIVNESNHLATVTENTLQWVRLDNATQVLRREWESMEEIVGAVLSRVRERDPARRIRAKVPSELPLLRCDPVLLAQLIGNLLDNALKYTATPIELVVQVSDDAMQVSVKDHGPGVPPAEQALIFEPFARGDQSGSRGAGLGLAVCRAIAVAHGGTLVLRSRQGGGCNFTLSLPLERQQPVKEST